ncbi:SigB/SigF/SigG family RNA polymerase sigma factor [Streptomyces sp. NPDC006368]|uniref:SigB/SigF/SigG family RNA polymerase sigma factor n=1 Tax=Streptomyces sp. NPDC006368 TaxID=3156760 RepID=UPI0033BA3E54
MTTAASRKTVPYGGAARRPAAEHPQEAAPKDARALTKLSFDRLAALEEGTPEYQYARNALAEMNMSLVHYAAGRFRVRADRAEDVVQVGMIGLIKAIDRFELSREVEFVTFAVPYIVGEIKRFFRDTSWSVHVPRRLQERRTELARATEELSGRLGRAPRVGELAALMAVSEDEVREVRLASNGYSAASLDAAAYGDGEHRDVAFADVLGTEDPGIERVDTVHSLAPLVQRLDERDRFLLHARFVEELTQAQIGERLGMSQMHVSRLLTRTLARLRAQLLATD